MYAKIVFSFLLTFLVILPFACIDREVNSKSELLKKDLREDDLFVTINNDDFKFLINPENHMVYCTMALSQPNKDYSSFKKNWRDGFNYALSVNYKSIKISELIRCQTFDEIDKLIENRSPLFTKLNYLTELSEYTCNSSLKGRLEGIYFYVFLLKQKCRLIYSVYHKIENESAWIFETYYGVVFANMDSIKFYGGNPDSLDEFMKIDLPFLQNLESISKYENLILKTYKQSLLRLIKNDYQMAKKVICVKMRRKFGFAE